MPKIDVETILQLQKRWERIRVANLYDTLDKMGYGNQCIDLGIRPLFMEHRMAGMAVTMRGSRDPLDYNDPEVRKEMEQKNPPSPRFAEHFFPGMVIVIDGGGELVTGKMGEMTSWSFKQKGAKGMVIDGYIRDYLGLKVIPDYCVCSRGTSPIESAKRWHINAIDVPIAMPGTLTSQIAVRPGDWIVAEADGVMVVPQEIADEALVKAEDIEQREEGMRQDLAKGVSFEDAYAKWGRA
jgi:4-hydroxy-4-methyl-2-oxoglutarate aldolase